MKPLDSYRSRTCAAAIAMTFALVLPVAGCGDDSDDDGGGADQGSATTAARETVSVDTVDGVGDVLVDSGGDALYISDQEQSGAVRCAGECARIWLPLAAPDNGEPSGPDEISAELGTARRPDGRRQVTYDGKPLYRFSQDGAPGQVTGDGLADSFGGERFEWSVVTTTGGQPDSSEEDSTGGGRSGYGY